MVETAVRAFGGLDAILSEAGIAWARVFLESTEEDWRRVMDGNGLGVLIGISKAARQMMRQGRGGEHRPRPGAPRERA